MSARMADAIRMLAAEAVEAAGSGHPGMPLGMADLATVLFTRHLRFDPAAPDWPDRDRFVLSAGHGSMLLYAVLHLTGYESVDRDQLRRFRQLGSLTPGHPEAGHTPGVETTTGPLGQGLATAVGMAIAERSLNARFGDDLVSHRTWVIAGDGCLQEGISQEAIELAGHLRLGNLIVLWDNNSITIDGSTSLSTSTDQSARFAAAGWQTGSVDGHDHEAIDLVLAAATANGPAGAPVFVDCTTTIGRGAPTKAGTASVHGAPLGPDELTAMRRDLGWTAEPFTVPPEVADRWRAAGRRGRAEREAWQTRLERSSKRLAFEAALQPGPSGSTTLDAVKKRFVEALPHMATRKASQAAIAATDGTNLLGGSADLTGSNLTRADHHSTITATDFSGSYVHYGIREHAMAAAMNGIALHGGFVPYGGTFLAFVDYLRPALRLSALMGTHVIYVLTHDSIGLGEDGPTHQPVEQIASLRAMPGVDVYRPADSVETVEAWQAALATTDRPSVLCLSRQNVPTLRTGHRPENSTAAGAYLVMDPGHRRDVTILASGSEVALAYAAADRMTAEGAAVAVVSMPCWERFERAPATYRAEVLGDAPRVGVEAASGFGWDRWIGHGALCGGAADDGSDLGARPFIGVDRFGASAPGPSLYDHFGITVDAIVETASRLIRSTR